MGLQLRPQILGVLTFASVWFGAVVPGAEASFPGRNGVIAFSRAGPHGESTLWVVNPRSGQTRQITHVPPRCGSRASTWFDEQPSFSGSGRLLVFYHEDQCRPDPEEGIYVIGADGSGRRLIRRTGDEDIEFPAISRTGEFVAFHESLGNILVIRVPGPREPLIDNYCDGEPRCQYVVFPRYLEAADPAWSSTGRLALSFGSTGGHIGITTLRDKNHRRHSVTNLVTRSVSDSKPDWSPRARRMAFYRWRVGKGLLVHSNVFVARADGRGRPRRLTKSLDASVPVWSPNGRRIAYVRASNDPDEFVGSLWTMRASDGGGKRPVASQIDPEGISWQPRPRR
jgi:Tol biopolymer transport system component